MHSTLIDQSVSLHFAAAGAGVEFLRELWARPGSSRYLTGASLLQAREELEDFIGFQPEDGYCSKTTALNMAVTAFLHAARSSSADDDLRQPIGVAVTAAVASDRIPRGDQRAHIGIVSERGIFHRSIDLDKCEGAENRTRHDALIAAALRDL